MHALHRGWFLEVVAICRAPRQPASRSGCAPLAIKNATISGYPDFSATSLGISRCKPVFPFIGAPAATREDQCPRRIQVSIPACIDETTTQISFASDLEQV